MLPANQHPMIWHVQSSESYKKDITEKGLTPEAAGKNQVVDYISQHFKDAHRTQPIIVGDREGLDPRTKNEDYNEAIIGIRSDYVSSLQDEKVDLRKIRLANENFCRTLGLQIPFGSTALTEIIQANSHLYTDEGKRRASLVLSMAKLTNQEILPLIGKYKQQVNDGKTDEQIRDEFNQFLCLHLLRSLMLWNQSSMGYQPIHFDERAVQQDPIHKVNLQLGVPYIPAIAPAERYFVVGPNHFEGFQHIPVATNGAIAAAELNVKGVENQKIMPLMRYVQVFNIQSLTTEMEEQGAPQAFLVNYGDIRVRPHGLPYLDRIFAAFTPQS
jgi:hypothetical protein